MLTVDDYALIRRMHVLEGRSIREIRRRLGHSRHTIAKVLSHPTLPGYRMAPPRAKRVLEPYISIIDAWLEQDKTAPRKPRHTGQEIYERLCKEHKYRGSVITPPETCGGICRLSGNASRRCSCRWRLSRAKRLRSIGTKRWRSSTGLNARSRCFACVCATRRRRSRGRMNGRRWSRSWTVTCGHWPTSGVFPSGSLMTTSSRRSPTWGRVKIARSTSGSNTCGVTTCSTPGSATWPEAMRRVTWRTWPSDRSGRISRRCLKSHRCKIWAVTC